jgi:hypothetical protein
MRVRETEIQAETDDTSAVAVASNMTTKPGTRGQKRARATPGRISGKDRTAQLVSTLKNNRIDYLSLRSDFSGFRMHSCTEIPKELRIKHGAWVESVRTEQAYTAQTGNLTLHYSFVQQC